MLLQLIVMIATAPARSRNGRSLDAAPDMPEDMAAARKFNDLRSAPFQEFADADGASRATGGKVASGSMPVLDENS